MMDNGFIYEYNNGCLYNYNNQNEFFYSFEEQNVNESFSKEDIKEYDNSPINENYINNEIIPQYDSFYPKLNLEPPNIITGETEPFSKHFINQKRNRDIPDNFNMEKEKEKEKEEINHANDINQGISKDNINKKIKRKVGEKTLGRRKKDKIYSAEAEHDKFKEDNIMRKIKSFFLKYILEQLNNSLKDKSFSFYPLDTILNKHLKKDFNEALLNKKIYEIFQEYETNKRYQKKQNSNKILIKKLFDEKKETETIKILLMSYRDILDYVREKDFYYFLNKIKEKEIKNNKRKNDNIDNYMILVKELLNKYENWFLKKNGRNVDKK